MNTTMPSLDERYMQLIAQGFSDKECAMKMHVKQSILVNEYLPAILRKAGLSTREEAVLYAQQKSDEEEQKGVSAEVLNTALKGMQMAQARAFYRALERHFFQDDCPGCKSYGRYGVLLVRGQFYQHMVAISPVDDDVFELILVLKESGMIHVQENDKTYRVTFKHLQPKEGHNDGDQAI